MSRSARTRSSSAARLLIMLSPLAMGPCTLAAHIVVLSSFAAEHHQPKTEAALLPITHIQRFAPRQEVARLKAMAGEAIGGNQSARARLEQIRQLFVRWNPLGATAAEVEAALGEPTKRSDEAMVYRIDIERHGVSWELKLKNGVVYGLTMRPYE